VLFKRVRYQFCRFCLSFEGFAVSSQYPPVLQEDESLYDQMSLTGVNTQNPCSAVQVAWAANQQEPRFPPYPSLDSESCESLRPNSSQLHKLATSGKRCDDPN
jgi:hypothetical protein